jgi:hypothetical protein
MIGGMPRSGTNLTRRIIGSHSKIALPPVELNFFRQHARGKSIREIFSDEKFKTLNVDVSDLYPKSYRDAFVGAVVRYAESVGKEIPGEKTPLNEFFYETILDWLHGFEVKFVHLVRNPHDVMASFKYAPFLEEKRNERFSSLDMAATCRNWSRSVALGLARARFRPENYYLIRYEDLAAEPARVSQELCNFLGVTFEKERMLSLVDYRGHGNNTSFSAANGQQPTGQTIHKPMSRKQHLSPDERRIVNESCGELARAIGYEDSGFETSPPERVIWGLRKRLKYVARKYNLLSG